MPLQRACSTKLKKYRAPALSVLLHIFGLTAILVNLDQPPNTPSRSGLPPAAITVIAAADMPALPPWPVTDSWQNQAPSGAPSMSDALSGDVPLLQTNNGFAMPGAAAPLPVSAPLPEVPQPKSEQRLVAYGHYDPAIFAAPTPAHNGQENVAIAQTVSALPAGHSANLAGLTGNGMGVDEVLKGQFRVRIVTTKDNAYLIVEITGGDMAMRGLLDETARHYRTYARYDANPSGEHNGSFFAPVLAALP